MFSVSSISILSLASTLFLAGTGFAVGTGTATLNRSAVFAERGDCASKFTGCSGPRVVGNTFDYQDGLHSLSFENCAPTVAYVRNNVFLNDGTQPGMSWAGDAPDSDYNCWSPENISPAETHSVNPSSTPWLDSSSYQLTTSQCPVYRTGDPAIGTSWEADLRGYYFYYPNHSMGAREYEVHTMDHTLTGGFIMKRTINGREYSQTFDSQGRLSQFIDALYPANNMTAEYDPMGRRVKTTVGAQGSQVVTRYVYDGDDVVADLVDEDGDGDVDRRRLYWILPQIDQRTCLRAARTGRSGLWTSRLPDYDNDDDNRIP